MEREAELKCQICDALLDLDISDQFVKAGYLKLEK